MMCECLLQGPSGCKECKPPCRDMEAVLAKCYGCEAVLDLGDSYWGDNDIGIYCQNCAVNRIAELWQRRA